MANKKINKEMLKVTGHQQTKAWEDSSDTHWDRLKNTGNGKDYWGSRETGAPIRDSWESEVMQLLCRQSFRSSEG